MPQRGGDPIAGIADHLQKFWDTRMTAAIVAHFAAGAAGLTETGRTRAEGREGGAAVEAEGDLTIVFDQAGGAEAALVRDRLDMFNVGVTGLSAYYPVHFFVKSARGETMGGLLGGMWGGWLHITYLWIDEAVRGRRWASKLMDRAEAYARERGCHSASLDTHSFQARPFYEKRGYEVFATLDDYPKGHKKFFLKKKL
jgi:ribosomal protein S18 acetylase RimI-like enzyme